MHMPQEEKKHLVNNNTNPNDNPPTSGDSSEGWPERELIRLHIVEEPEPREEEEEEEERE